MIAFVLANDSWEAWDILKKVCSTRKSLSTNKSKKKLTQILLANPKQLFNTSHDEGNSILMMVKEIVNYWQINEFSFVCPSRRLAAELINNILDEKYDVLPELMYLMDTLNPIKMRKEG